MDVSIEDDKKTLTMVDPDLGQSLDIIDVLPGMDQDDPPIAESTCQAQDLPQNLNSSKAVEDNSEKILKLFGTEFAELTSGKDLDEYLAVHSHDRVIVSVEKLLELHGKICSAEHDGQVCGKQIHHSVSLCASRVEISWQCRNGHANKWVSSEVLAKKHNSMVYVNDSLLATALSYLGITTAKFP